jgi:hypothetical protein
MLLKMYYYVIFLKAVTSHWYNSKLELQYSENMSFHSDMQRYNFKPSIFIYALLVPIFI